MAISKNKSIFSLILFSAVAVTLVGTPMWNKDALVIPKVIILFLVALYLTPIVLKKSKTITKNRISKFFIVILSLLLVQYIAVVITSSAPIEQQIFGRSGRGIGLITLLSIACMILASALFIEENKVKTIITMLALAGFVSALYGILQSYGLDPLAWEAKNNRVIGTLGNPNFQSSILAMSFMPILVYGSKFKYRFIAIIFFISLIIFAIYRAESTQGYIGIILSASTFIIIFIWYKTRIGFFLVLTLVASSGLIAILGMLDKGPLSTYLYKQSVQSRGDFWRSAFSAANDHPFFGVGLDSFGDYFLKYRDQRAVNHPFFEFTDSAHNYLLDYAVTGGFFLLILNLALIILTIYSFLQLQKKYNGFDANLSSLFCVFVVFQAQSMISPFNISLMLWNAIVMGSIIGLNIYKNDEQKTGINKDNSINSSIYSFFAVFLGILLVFPYFNSDRLQLLSMKNGDGDLAIKSTKMYPESVVRYSVMSRELLHSGLKIQSLDLARSAVKFNSNSPALWALILVNPEAPLSERKFAQEQILKLDPLNVEVKKYFD